MYYLIVVYLPTKWQTSAEQISIKLTDSLHGRNLSPVLAMPAQKGAEATGVSASSQTMNAYVIAIKVNIFIYVML